MSAVSQGQINKKTNENTTFQKMSESKANVWLYLEELANSFPTRDASGAFFKERLI